MFYDVPWPSMICAGSSCPWESSWERPGASCWGMRGYWGYRYAVFFLIWRVLLPRFPISQRAFISLSIVTSATTMCNTVCYLSLLTLLTGLTLLHCSTGTLSYPPSFIEQWWQWQQHPAPYLLHPHKAMTFPSISRHPAHPPLFLPCVHPHLPVIALASVASSCHRSSSCSQSRWLLMYFVLLWVSPSHQE